MSDADAITGVTSLDVDNINIDGNTISATDSNGDMLISANGTANITVPSNSLTCGDTGGEGSAITVNGGKVTVFTKHGMSEKHFIVRHTLVLADGSVIGAKVFSGTDKEAKSSYELPAGYKGKIFATSFCNLHDLWLNEATV